MVAESECICVDRNNENANIQHRITKIKRSNIVYESMTYILSYMPNQREKAISASRADFGVTVFMRKTATRVVV